MDEKLTADEAIRILEEIKTIDDGLGQYIKDFDKAMNMALRSLKAWNGVKESANAKYYTYANPLDRYLDDYRLGWNDAMDEILSVIEDYLEDEVKQNDI